MSAIIDPDDPWRGQPYEGLARACFFIALDNGGINRDRSAEDWARDYTAFAEANEDGVPIMAINDWLKTIDPPDLETLCTGEGSLADAIAEAGPKGVSDLLNRYFEEVC